MADGLPKSQSKLLSLVYTTLLLIILFNSVISIGFYYSTDSSVTPTINTACGIFLVLTILYAVSVNQIKLNTAGYTLFFFGFLLYFSGNILGYLEIDNTYTKMVIGRTAFVIQLICLGIAVGGSGINTQLIENWASPALLISRKKKVVGAPSGPPPPPPFFNPQANLRPTGVPNGLVI